MKVIDRKFRNARVWSNSELKKMADLLTGRVCNISAWEDKDKEGSYYRKYFCNANSYSITNYEDKDARGSQGNINDEILLNLENTLDEKLINKFDVVFNHTTLEHIFEINAAFKNICLMTTDIAIIVVPFLQETHGGYGDYWRFTPQSIDKLFKKNGMETIYISANEQSKDSIYIFAVGSKNADKWQTIRALKGNSVNKIYTDHIGLEIIRNSLLDNILNKLRFWFK